jgi:hypothetical protein
VLPELRFLIYYRTLDSAMFRPLFLAFFSTLFLFSVQARADQLQDGEAAYGHGDFQEAKRNLLPLSEKGDARAQIILAEAYQLHGDPAEALKWYLLAVKDQEHHGVATQAAFTLGAMYERGIGVKQSTEEAYYWYSLMEAFMATECAPEPGCKHDWSLHGFYDTGENAYRLVDLMSVKQREAIDKRVRETLDQREAEWRKTHPAAATEPQKR